MAPSRIFAALKGMLIIGSVATSVLMIAFLVAFFGPGPHVERFRVLIPQGTSLRAVSNKLAASAVIRSATIFEVMTRLQGRTARLKAGEYDVPTRASMAQVQLILMRGVVVLHPLTIPEGLTSQQVMVLLDNAAVLVGDAEVPAEGSLLPETYYVPRGQPRAGLIKEMQAAKKNVLDELWPKRQKELPIKTREQALILASIVEKETGIDGERPMVAAVFINRLKREMRLQSDPTIIYGLVGGIGTLGRPLRRSEIERKTTYNTYRINGLPPTPVANAGRAAIAAVLNPASSKALYFVADGSGGHAFADTLIEHNKNVRHWRRIEKSGSQ